MDARGPSRSAQESEAAAADLDVYIPPFYRHSSNSRYGYPTAIVTIDYGTADTLSTSGAVEVGYAPYVQQHKTEAAVGGGGDVFTAASSQWRPEELRANAKQGLMEVLLGGAAGAGDALLSDVGRALPAPSVAEEVQSRVRGARCDATYVTSAFLMVSLVRMILAKRTDPARSLVDCVTAIDISNTQLGKVTPDGPPLYFDESGNELPTPPDAVVMRFYPDESPRRAESPAEVKRSVAERSLALTYVAPLLFTPGMRLYRIRELVCSHCGLTDTDAHALALILKTGRRGGDGGRRHRGPAAFFRPRASEKEGVVCCTLETLDISFNRITDTGMAEIKHALKHNRHITSIVVAGNEFRNKKKVIDGIERRLRRNREGKTSVSWMHLRHWKRVVKGK